MITIEHNELSRQHGRGLITDREYAHEVWHLLLKQMPYLAGLEPTEVLADVTGLPVAIADAYHAIEPRELAERLLASPALAEDEIRIVPLRPFLALRIYRVADDGRTPRYGATIVTVAGRDPARDGAFSGPWFAHHPGTLIAVALDDAANLDALERLVNPVEPAGHVAGLAWISAQE